MQDNVRHLIWIWILAGLVVLPVTAGLVYQIRKGDSLAYVEIGAAACIIVMSVIRTQRGVQKAFAHPTPDQAIALYSRLQHRTPNGKAMKAYLCAHAATLYGDFDRARQELCGVNWSSLPPMYQAFESHMHSLFAIFESRDYGRALEFAQESLDLAAVPAAFPGARTTRRALSAQVAVCRLLLGNPSDEILRELEVAVGKLPGVGRAVPAWALAGYYHRVGDEPRATRHLMIAHRLLPRSPLVADYRTAGSSR
jgi:hypothetical protein